MTSKTPWTRLEGTRLWELAKATYEHDPRRKYHAFPHPMRLYAAAAEFALPYDLALDRAILAHDVIYDEHPHKEIRSADWLRAVTGEECDEETRIIHLTINHEIVVGGDNRIQILDFADMRCFETTDINRNLFKAEAALMNGTSPEKFAQGNMAYFKSKLAMYTPELIAKLPEWEAQALSDIVKGMRHTVSENEKFLGLI